MATVKINLTNSWQLAANAGKNFILENLSSYAGEFCFSDTPPADNAPSHTLLCGDIISRMGVSGALYVRDKTGNGGQCVIAVSVEA